LVCDEDSGPDERMIWILSSEHTFAFSTLCEVFHYNLIGMALKAMSGRSWRGGASMAVLRNGFELSPC
jgi:hypothetical protein